MLQNSYIFIYIYICIHIYIYIYKCASRIFFWLEWTYQFFFFFQFLTRRVSSIVCSPCVFCVLKVLSKPDIHVYAYFRTQLRTHASYKPKKKRSIFRSTHRQSLDFFPPLTQQTPKRGPGSKPICRILVSHLHQRIFIFVPNCGDTEISEEIRWSPRVWMERDLKQR